MFKEEHFINREDIIKERTTADFCHWVEKKDQEWASKIEMDPDGKRTPSPYNPWNWTI